MRQAFVAADKIVFLGFAFHDQNLKLLRPEVDLDRKMVFGTGFGMSDNDISVVKAQLTQFFNTKARLSIAGRLLLEKSLKCAELLDHYGKSLPA